MSLALGEKRAILVGANNSGKTSCIGALHTFFVRPENLRIRDVSKQNWKSISAIGTELEDEKIEKEKLDGLAVSLAGLLPSLDVTIDAKASEAYKARDILPHLEWRGGSLAVRIAYEPENIAVLQSDFLKARSVISGTEDVSLWPKDLFDYLEKGRNFSKHFKQSHYILSLEDGNASKDESTDENNSSTEPSLQPIKLSAISKLVRVDVISEQRGLGSEDGIEKNGAFSEKQRLNKLMREYYDRFLNPEDFPEAADLEVLKKQQEMEDGFTKRLEQQFKAPLKELEDMGYPGIGGNPSVEIAAKISGTDALQKSSSVRYRFDKSDADTLPESYLGLGYQNLIYLTFRLLEFRDKWMRVGKSASSDDELAEQIEPIHLVLLEEPEVNLHAQVQRVFVAKAYETLRNHPELGCKSEFHTQLVVSTHSSHIVNDVDFRDLLYFRRNSHTNKIGMDHSIVESMSDLFDDDRTELKFVRKHLKLTHCDIFFADGVIFVEGQAERLLVPEFIAQGFDALSRRYISILEVNGAHTHKYKDLIEKLGVATLIITDLDSVDADGKSCAPERNKNQKTNNNTLKSWHPKKPSIDDLVDLPKDDREAERLNAPTFVAYQKPIKLDDQEVLGRTFEDALILANFENEYFQQIDKIKDAKTVFEKGSKPLSKSLFEYVQKLTKGDFAFNCLFHIAENDANSFVAPEYICEGLEWLTSELSPKQTQ